MQKRNTGEVVKYEPYQPLSFEEAKENLQWRIGTVFNRDYWGHGYASESCEALIERAFSKGVHRIYAECDPDNKCSWKYWKRWDFRGKLIFGKMCISGKMKPEL